MIILNLFNFYTKDAVNFEKFKTLNYKKDIKIEIDKPRERVKNERENIMNGGIIIEKNIVNFISESYNHLFKEYAFLDFLLQSAQKSFFILKGQNDEVLIK